MNTYEIIKELAKRKKISIRQLEMKFGYSNGYLAKWKNARPNTTELTRLANFFDVTVDYLLGIDDKPVDKVVELTEKDVRFSFDGKEVSDEIMRAAIALIETMSKK